MKSLTGALAVVVLLYILLILFLFVLFCLLFFECLVATLKISFVQANLNHVECVLYNTLLLKFILCLQCTLYMCTICK